MDEKKRLISIWIGVDDDTFDEYINYDTYGPECGFCRDIGQGYDVDTTCIYVDKEIIPVGKLVDEIPFSESFENEFLEKCHEKGIIEARACVAMWGRWDEFVEYPDEQNFGGLRFIGIFQFD
ncbi:hypothetical protein YV76_004648 [Salmonella enterica subsp. enterica]|nr:hypothetical protein [Salmonella enterica subsp. enterica]